MANKRYHASLTSEQRKMLQELISAGKESARTLSHARILLKADRGPDGPKWTDADIAQALEVSTATVVNVRQRFCEAGGGWRVADTKDCKQRCIDVSLTASTRTSWTGCGRLIWWRSPVHRRQTEGRAGRCVCWRRRWWSLSM